MPNPGLVLGFHGCDYFWENDPHRALEFANEVADRKKIETPFVVGAILDLGHCLNLVENANLKLLHEAYLNLKIAAKEMGIALPKNRRLRRGSDLLFRDLDCAVIQGVHSTASKPYDSVRGVFWEGAPLYPGAGFKRKNHIQICVINPICIQGYFRRKVE